MSIRTSAVSVYDDWVDPISSPVSSDSPVSTASIPGNDWGLGGYNRPVQRAAAITAKADAFRRWHGEREAVRERRATAQAFYRWSAGLPPAGARRAFDRWTDAAWDAKAERAALRRALRLWRRWAEEERRFAAYLRERNMIEAAHNLARERAAMECNDHADGMRRLHFTNEAQHATQAIAARRVSVTQLETAQLQAEAESNARWHGQQEVAKLAVEAEAEQAWSAVKQLRCTGVAADVERVRAELVKDALRRRDVEQTHHDMVHAQMCQPLLAMQRSIAADGLARQMSGRESQFYDRYGDLLDAERASAQLGEMNAHAVHHAAAAAEGRAAIEHHNLTAMRATVQTVVQENDDIQMLHLRVEEARLNAELAMHERQAAEHRLETARLMDRQGDIRASHFV